jgi:hypothetical protein
LVVFTQETNMNRFVVVLSCVLLASIVSSHSLKKKDDKSGTENASKKVMCYDLWLSVDNIYVLYDCCIVCILLYPIYYLWSKKQ